MDRKEKWRPVAGNPNYAVSNLGRVKRIRPGRATLPGKLRRPFDNNGYVRYALFVDGVRHNRLAHVMVYEAFVGRIPDGFELNHKNGVKTDNRPDNLELVTGSENCRHAFRVLNRKQVKPNAKHPPEIRIGQMGLQQLGQPLSHRPSHCW